MSCFAQSNLTKCNSVEEGNNRKPVGDVRRWKCATILPHYCRYRCWLRGTSSDYQYQIRYAMLNVPSTTQWTWKFMQKVAKKNTWTHAVTTCALGHRGLNWREWPQAFGLRPFNEKLCVESFFCEYSWMYDAGYPPPALERSGWGYAYALMVENRDWSKI